ncbi:MAG: hypothetical protein Q8P18_05505 [Pseudomonadota bacterium]|nr:hypothetical protein [Pseudomonadota bacterium]
MFLFLTQLVLAAGVLSGAVLAQEPVGPPLKDVDSVRHAGTWTPEALAWETTVSTTGASGRLYFALPVPGPLEVSGRASAVEGPLGIVALDVASGPQTVTVRARQTADTGLYPPLLAGGGVQRVTLVNADWVPDAALGLELRLDRTTSPDVPRAACLEGHHLGEPRPICVIADDRVTRAGGLLGPVRPASESRGAFAVAIGCAFAGLVCLLVLGNRWLTQRAKDEVLEAYVREEFVKR